MEPQHLPIPKPAIDAMAARGLGRPVGGTSLAGGMISLVRRLTTDRGASVVLKQCTSADAPADLYGREAEGLDALRHPDAPRVPAVLAADRDFILLEDLGPPMPDPPAAAWEAFGHAVAAQHARTAPQFGFGHDNYLGLIPQRNAWADDGVGLWVDRRVLHYLPHPLVQRVLTADDRRGVERFCAFARRHLPPQRPALLHGDLWYANALVTTAGRPATVDPAVYYGLAEAEVSLTKQWGRFPEQFYDAYAEHGLLADGWRERLELYNVAQLVGILAHVGEDAEVHGMLRALVAKYV